jgi:hypothetical protein
MPKMLGSEIKQDTCKYGCCYRRRMLRVTRIKTLRHRDKRKWVKEEKDHGNRLQDCRG